MTLSPPGEGGSQGTQRVTLLVPVLCVVFVLSVMAAAAAEEAAPLWRALGPSLVVGSAAGGLATALSRQRGLLPWLAVAGMVGLALWRTGTALEAAPQPWREAPRTPMRAIAVVDAPAETRGGATAVYARIERIDRPEGLPPPAGRVRLTVAALPPYDVGDEIEVAGRFEPVDPAAHGRRLLAQGVVATASFPDVLPTGRRPGESPTALLHRLRTAIQGTIQQTLPEPHATLLAGLLLGLTGGMPDDFKAALAASGTTHMVVVSGYNITLVAGALYLLARRGRYLRAAVPLVGVWAFAFLAGGEPPTIRAAIMVTLALLARLTGRGTDALAALGLAAAAMLLSDPLLISDLSFQLSGLATLGLVTLQPRVSALMPPIHPWIREPLAGTLAAQLATVPLLAATFHQISLVSPVANALAAPAVPVATIGGAAGVAAVAALPLLAAPVGAILAIPTGYLALVIQAAASVPAAVAPVGEIPAVLVVLYSVGLLLWAAAPTPEGRSMVGALSSSGGRRAIATGLGALAAASIVGGAAVPQAPILTFSVLDVAGGDAVLVRTPGQRTVLIDGGPSPPAVLAQMGRRLGLTERDLAVAILTRADSARLPGAVAALERYSAALAISPPEGSPSALFQRWRAAAEPRTVVADAPLRVELEPGVFLDLTPLAPAPGASRREAVQRSLIVRLTYGEIVFLVAPSLTPDAARGLMAEGWPLSATVLVVPRGGGPGALDSAALDAIAPSVAVLPSGGRGRPADRPSQEAVDLLERVPVFRTDLYGTVELKTDGRRLWVTPERGRPQ